MEYDVFISYSRKDMAVADEITQALDAAGITYFIDRQGIAGGMEFPVVLARAIVESRVFLYLASRNSYTSKFTNNEITFAFNKKEKNCILPYIIDDSQLPLEIEFVFAGINWRTRSQHPIPTLVADLRTLLGRPAQAVPSKPSKAEIEEWWKKGKTAYTNSNYGEALKWYKKAAEQGYAKAQYEVGFMYYFGKGVAKDLTETVRWYYMAAEQGNTNALYHLGDMHKNGICVTQNNTEAAKLYHKAAELGDDRAQLQLAEMYEDGEYFAQDDTEAARWYRKAAQQGNVVAQSHLGEMYECGKGVEQDYAEAMRWYQAAEQGYEWPEAEYHIGKLYHKGYGVTQDYTEAIRWYRKAADQDYEEAQYTLGVLYEKGEGVTKDNTEAVRWYRKAAEYGHENAQKALNRLL